MMMLQSNLMFAYKYYCMVFKDIVWFWCFMCSYLVMECGQAQDFYQIVQCFRFFRLFCSLMVDISLLSN